MIDKIFIFETRQLPYLDSYKSKAKSLGFTPIILSEKDLADNMHFEEFKKVYQHLSVNKYEFEMNCYARYFAIQSVLDDDHSFILSDSDIYITDRLAQLKNENSLKDVFVGSEGFIKDESELQISPHFSIWNRNLLNGFIQYLIEVYKQNIKDQSLVKHFDRQTKRLGRTSISDMTLLYMWVYNNKIPYINSNDHNNKLGIDHNISALRDVKSFYQVSFNRKKVHISPETKAYFILESGEKYEMSVIHFQGGYKRILNEFYLGHYAKFFLFSMYINLGRKVRQILSKIKR